MFQHITSKDGLAADKANCIFQDSKGYYWVGTDNGLQKFDGKNFSNILSGNGDKNGTSSIVTNAPILEDKEGNIWAHSGGSISVYHPLTGKSENIEIHDYSLNSAASAIQHFCKDEWGDIWLLTYTNLYKYDYKIHKPVLWSHVFFKVPGYPWAKIIYDHTCYRSVFMLNELTGLDHFFQLVLLQEIVGQAKRIVDAHELVQCRTAEVGIDHQHPLSTLRKNGGKVANGGGLAFAGAGADHGHRIELVVLAGEQQVRAQHAIRFAVRTFGALFQEVADVLGDDSQHWRLQGALDVVDGLDAGIEIFNEECEADTDDEADNDAERDIQRFVGTDRA